MRHIDRRRVREFVNAVSLAPQNKNRFAALIEARSRFVVSRRSACVNAFNS
jgi:hypothetical protein